MLTLKQLREKRAQLLREAEALKTATGTFENDQQRTAFDAKMTEIDAVDEQIRTAEAADASVSSTAAPQNATEIAQRAIADERARVRTITDAVRVAGLDESVGRTLVDNGTAVDAARAHIFEQLAARSNAQGIRNHTIEGGEDARDKFRRGALNWLIVRSGMAGIIAKHEGKDVRSYDAGEFRGFTLMDLARESLMRAGVRVGGDKMELVGRAFMERSTQSTSDFTYLLENTMHKSLQAAYALAEVTWPKFCATSSVSDFRAHNRYRMGAFSVLDTVKEDGEFKNKPITDAEKATITAVTKGNIIVVSRQMIVNDDMNAFGRLMGMLGGAAARSVEEDIYTLLASNSGDGPTMPYDSVAMFHTSSHGANKTTGAALSAAALDADRVAMAKQKDKDSNAYLNLRPAILLVDSSLGGQARVINASQYDPDTVANKSQMKPNIVAGLFREIVDSPYISNASFVNSSTRRYLFADPSIAPVLEVAFLDGQSQPVIETQDGWRVDGTEMKIRFDYATAGVDHRGAVTNAGA